MIELSEFVSDYMRVFRDSGEKPPSRRDVLRLEIAEAYVDACFSEMGISENEIDLAVHSISEQVEYYL